MICNPSHANQAGLAAHQLHCAIACYQETPSNTRRQHRPRQCTTITSVHATPTTTMANTAARTIHHPLLFVVVLISLLATLAADGVGVDGGRRCPTVPSMTAERACTAVSGTCRMRGLCLRTLRAGAGAAA
ncbi:hypothetical protein PVAP13_6NG036915 [Panicum virgatum]|uniref:Uncharacterized protein n=1 Tax=Panicum virgatum TaxID=38727 RepID=A0A8T0QUF6_PANVG|nr:hypothetical protein PVAP13_6NG036915 [Panicum virgatum]